MKRVLHQRHNCTFINFKCSTRSSTLIIHSPGGTDEVLTDDICYQGGDSEHIYGSKKTQGRKEASKEKGRKEASKAQVSKKAPLRQNKTLSKDA